MEMVRVGMFRMQRPAGSKAPAGGWVLCGALLWLLGVGVGMGILGRHMLTPGPAAQAPSDWPRASTLRPATDGATLLMWCHPRCPCTRASLDELATLVTRVRERGSVEVRFLRPPGYSEAWVHGELWRQAAAIPGVRVAVDDGGEARHFGARTSGQVLIFGRDHRLLFSGGLTGGRGHLGDNDGLAKAQRLLQSGAGKFETAPVFGCALFSADENRVVGVEGKRE